MGNSWTSGSDLLGEWGMQVFNPILGFIEFYPDGVRPELRLRGLDRQGRDRGGWRKLTLSVRYQHFELGHAHTLSLGESQLFYTGQFSLCFLVCAPWPTRGQAWASHCCAIYFPVPGSWHRVGVQESFVVESKWTFGRELWKTPLCNFWPSWIIVDSIRSRWIGKWMSKRNEALRLWEMCLRPFTC